MKKHIVTHLIYKVLKPKKQAKLKMSSGSKIYKNKKKMTKQQPVEFAINLSADEQRDSLMQRYLVNQKLNGV